MKWLSRLLGSLLAITLMVTAVAWVSNSTVWNSDYVLKTASSHGFYDGVAKALPPVLIDTSATGDQRYLLSQLITTSFVRVHLEDAIAGLQKYYRDGGTPPSLDLSDVKRQFDALGLVPPPLVATLINKPVELSNPAVDAVAQGASQKTALLLWLAPATAAVIIVIIAAITGRRRWSALAGAAVGAAGVTAIASGISLIVPGIATMSLATSAWGQLAGPLKGLGDAISRDVSQRLLWWAVGFGIAAVVLGACGVMAAAAHRMRRHPDKPTPAE